LISAREAAQQQRDGCGLGWRNGDAEQVTSAREGGSTGSYSVAGGRQVVDFEKKMVEEAVRREQLEKALDESGKKVKGGCRSSQWGYK
jgi:hypothetical protein